MDQSRVFQKAWQITRRYRALWVFGVILALTTVSWASLAVMGGGRDSESEDGIVRLVRRDRSFELEWPILDSDNDRGNLIFNYKHERDGTPVRQGDVIINYNPPDEYSVGWASTTSDGRLELHTLKVGPAVVRTLIAIGIGLASVLLLYLVVAPVARYVSETALIRSVDAYERTGETRSVRKGFAVGWSRAAFRLFLIDLMINIPLLLGFAVLFSLSLVPLALWRTGSAPAGVLGTFVTVGLLLFLLVLAVIAAVTLSTLKHFFRRASALEGLGVVDAIHRGYSVVRQNLKDVGLVWLVMVVLNVAWPILMAPLAVLLVGAGLLLGGALAILTGGLAALVLESGAPWLVGAAVGIPVFFLVLIAPLAFLGGLREVFQSSSWTLTYRALHTREKVAQAGRAEISAPALI